MLEEKIETLLDLAYDKYNLEEKIETLLNLAYDKYKKLGGNCSEGFKLTKKIPVEIDNIVFTGWREYVAYRVCLYLRENFPLLRLELILDGNSSQIKVEINEVETENISQCLEKLIPDWKVL